MAEGVASRLACLCGQLVLAILACGIHSSFLYNKIYMRTFAALGITAVCTAYFARRLLQKTHKRRVRCILIRHAQSMGNVAAEQGAAHQCPRDAKISRLGLEQCATAKTLVAEQVALAELHGWLLASSPLTRALETTEHVWPEAVPHRRAVAAELREYLIDRDDVGTPRTTLQVKWPKLASAMEHLDEVWWSLPAGADAKSPPDAAYGGEDGYHRPETDGQYGIIDREHVERRAKDALDWIFSQPETKVAVVAHSVLLGQMLSLLNVEASHIPNCYPTAASSCSRRSRSLGWTIRWIRSCTLAGQG